MADSNVVPKSDVKQLVVLTKLENSDQWFRWKKNMTLYFKSKGLWSYLESDGLDNVNASASVDRRVASGKRSGSAAPAPADETMDDRQQFEVMSDILRSLGDAFAGLVLNDQTPRQMWIRLEQHIEGNLCYLLDQLSLEINRTQYSSGHGGMERHVANFRTLVARYRSLGGTLDDHELTLRFLQSIPTNANYQTVRTLLRTHARTNDGKYDLELAFQYVQETAQDLNEWYPKPDAADPSPAFATSVTTPSSAPNSVRVCYSCGRPGHIQKYCRAARKKQESRTSNPGKDGGGNTKSGPVVGWMTRVVSAKAAYFTGKKSNCVCGNPTCTPWVLDSAASRHMEICKRTCRSMFPSSRILYKWKWPMKR